MTPPRIDFVVPGYAIGAVRRADGSGGWLVDAHDQERDRPVLLKVIERRAAQDADGIRVEERLRREARAAARVHHPSVVRMFDLGETPALLYLVMERIDAPDADTVVRRDGPLPPMAACRVARDVARGLEELHRCGVVHRDITPGNVLIPPPATGGEAIIVDLGLARLRDLPHGLTADDVLLGTPGFMAPEQAENPREADARADLYGLGALLFFLLTGRPPFVGEGLEAVRLALRGGAPDVRTLAPAVSPPLARLTARLLARDPADRPAGAAEVAGALDALLDELAETQAVTTGDIPTPIVVAAVAAAGDTPGRRHPVAIAGFAAGLIGALALGLQLWWGGDAPSHDTASRTTDAAPPAAATTPAPTPRTAASPAPPQPATPPPPPVRRSPNEAATLAFETAEQLMAVPPVGGHDWTRFVLAHYVLTAVRDEFPMTWAATRARARLDGIADGVQRRRSDARAKLLGAVEHALTFGYYRFAAEEVERASTVLVDRGTRLRLRAEVLDAARESFEREYQSANQIADSGRPDEAARALERYRESAHPNHLVIIDRLIRSLRTPGGRRRRVDAEPAQRPAEPLEALADRALARRKARRAVELLRPAVNDPAYAEARPVIQGRLAEAEAVAGFLDRLLAALAARVGSRLPMPGGTHGELLEVHEKDGMLVWRRAGGKSGRPLADLPAAFLDELARLALPAQTPADALALGALHFYEGSDATAVSHLERGAEPAARLRALAQSRIDAARDEKARSLLDRARAAWVRGAPATALRRLDRLRAGGLLRDAGPVREAFDDLYADVSRRLSGLDGLVSASITAGPSPDALRLEWRTSEDRERDRDRGVPAGDLLQLSPRWAAPFAATWEGRTAEGAAAAEGSKTEIDRVYRIALRTEAGSEALVALRPDGTLSLQLDGRDPHVAEGATLPLTLQLVARRGTIVLDVRAGDARLGGMPWRTERGLSLAVGRAPGRFTVRGAVDAAWLQSARAAAERPSAPTAVRLIGPPREAIVRWAPPLQGHAAAYVLHVATSEGDSLLAPIGSFRAVGRTTETSAPLRNFAKGAVLGVVIEPIGRDGRPGPASPVRFVCDLRGAGAVALGGDGERYITVPGPVPLIRLRADGRPEAVAGTPKPARRTAPASRGLAVATSRGGWRIALTDPLSGHAWTWVPGEAAAPLGAGIVRGGGGVSVDGIGNWWVAAPGQGRLYSFYGRDRGLIAPVEGPEQAKGFAERSPSHVAVLHDGRLAAADPRNDRVVIYEPRLGWFKVQSVIDGLTRAEALAAGPRGTLWVATRAGVTSVTPPAGPDAHMAPPIHRREVDGVPLKRVTGLAAGPDGTLWVLDGGAGRLLRRAP
ncbi:MAG: protein kinase domain-containing protein [Planctomycetota bacterium]|jgi:serine/threonine-protein kinase